MKYIRCWTFYHFLYLQCDIVKWQKDGLTAEELYYCHYIRKNSGEGGRGNPILWNYVIKK